MSLICCELHSITQFSPRSDGLPAVLTVRSQSIIRKKKQLFNSVIIIVTTVTHKSHCVGGSCSMFPFTFKVHLGLMNTARSYKLPDEKDRYYTSLCFSRWLVQHLSGDLGVQLPSTSTQKKKSCSSSLLII